MLSYQTEYRLQGLFFDFSTQNFIVVLYSLSSHQMMGNCFYRLLLVDFQISVARRKYPIIFVISFGCIDEIWSDVVNSVSESWLLSQRTTNWMYLGIFFSWETSRGRIIWHVRNILKHSCFRPLSYWVYTLYGTLEINYFNHVLGAFFVSIHLFTFLHHFFYPVDFSVRLIPSAWMVNALPLLPVDIQKEPSYHNIEKTLCLPHPVFSHTISWKFQVVVYCLSFFWTAFDCLHHQNTGKDLKTSLSSSSYL